MEIVMHRHDPIWDRFFDPEVNPTVYKKSKYVSTPGNIYVRQSFFIRCKQNGAIRVENSENNRILTSESFFYDTYAQQFGGSIYADGGYCIQYRVCSIKSSISDDHAAGCHSYVLKCMENFIIESSISKCIGYLSAVSLSGGNQLIDSSNISYIKCTVNSAFSSISNEELFKVNYSSIFNNTCQYQCIMYHINGEHSVNSCNVIRNANDKTIDIYGVVWNQGCNLRIEKCIFSENNVPSIFAVGYNSDDFVFLVDQCLFADNEAATTVSGLFSVNITTANELDLKLRLYTYQQCDEIYLSLYVPPAEKTCVKLIGRVHPFVYDSLVLLIIRSQNFISRP